MKNQSKKWIAIALGVVVIVGAAVMIIPTLLAPDFKKELAAKLGVNAEFLHINIPPAADRKPGFTFVVRGSVLPVLFPESDDSKLRVGETFDLDWSTFSQNSASGGVAATGFLDTLFGKDLEDRISLRATECQILELPLEDVRDRLLKSDEVLKAADASNPVFVVVRSFQGKLEMKVRKASEISGEAWTEKISETNNAIDSSKIKVNSSNDREMTLAWQNPTVFAFEAMEAKLITTHLGSAPDRVELLQITPTALQSGLGVTAQANPEKKIRLAVSGRFFGPLSEGRHTLSTME